MQQISVLILYPATLFYSLINSEDEFCKEEFDTKKPKLVLSKFLSCLSIHFPGRGPSPLKEGKITLLDSLEGVN